MAECFLVSVELESLTEQSGLDLRTLSFLHRLYVRVTPKNYPSAISFLQKYFNEFTTYCDVTALTNPKDIISLLGNGAVKVSASYSQIKALAENGLEGLGRLVLSVDLSTYDRDSEEAVEEFKRLPASCCRLHICRDPPVWCRCRWPANFGCSSKTNIHTWRSSQLICDFGSYRRYLESIPWCRPCANCAS